MYYYITTFIKLYPYLLYIMTIYDLFGYISFIRNMYQCIYYKLNHPRNKEIDEIYDMILETEPGELEVIIDNDTNYVKYNEADKKINEKWYN